MKSYTEQNPTFSESIQITEPTDAAHADNVNAAPKQLLQNDLVIKKKIEDEIKRNFEALHGLVHKTVTISANRIVETGGGVTATTTIQKTDAETTFVTSIEKGTKRYTKTEIIRKTKTGTTVEISYREER